MSDFDLTGLLLLAANEGAEAAQEVHGHFDLFGIISQFINLIILAILVGWFLRWWGLKEYLAGRREKIEEGLTIAREKQEEADRLLQKYEHKLAHLEDEIRAVVGSHEKQGEADRVRLEEEADKAIERLIREVDFTIRQESLKAQKAIREAGVDATVSEAERLLEEKITESDRSRLVDDFIREVQMSSQAGT